MSPRVSLITESREGRQQRTASEGLLDEQEGMGLRRPRLGQRAESQMLGMSGRKEDFLERVSWPHPRNLRSECRRITGHVGHVGVRLMSTAMLEYGLCQSGASKVNMSTNSEGC